MHRKSIAVMKEQNELYGQTQYYTILFIERNDSLQGKYPVMSSGCGMYFTGFNSI